MEGKANIRETAHFLRENPRFFNEPICTIEDESVSTVADCLEWNVVTTPPSSASSSSRRGLSSSAQSSLQLGRLVSHSSDSMQSNISNPQKNRTNEIVYHNNCHKPIHGGNQPKSTIKGILDPKLYTNGTDFKERISFYNQYNCRIDPSEPTKGKLHGSFVWDAGSRCGSLNSQ